MTRLATCSTISQTALRQMIMVTVAMWPLAASASVAPPTGPATSTGDYTITYPTVGSAPICVTSLEEASQGSSLWSTVPDPNHDGVVMFTNKQSGTYDYRVKAECEHMYSEEEWVEISTSISVQVDNSGNPALPDPVPESLEEQIKFDYVTKVGDINSDGLDDILVSRVSGGGPLDGSIDDVLLRNLGNGSFSYSVPSAYQLGVATSWPSAQIPILLNDLNADSFADIVLAEIDNEIPGAMEQIIFAPAQINDPQPLGLRSIDSDLRAFVNDVAAFGANPNYFDENEVETYVGYWETSYDCEFFLWGESWESVCYTTQEWVEEDVITYPGITDSAVAIWEAWKAYESGTGDYSAISSIISSIFGVAIGNPDECVADDLAIYFQDIPNQSLCPGSDVSRSVENFRVSLLWVDEPEEETYFGRRPDVVYVTGHRIFGWAPTHLALEYRDPITLTAATISAGPGTPTNYVLISAPDRRSDSPEKNFTVAVVNSALPHALYFAALEEADGHYNDCLTYDAAPSSTEEEDYNSNSFVAGIVAATMGQPDFSAGEYTSFYDFVGGETWVPAEEFTSQARACE